MSEKRPPLTCARVKQILTTLGFSPRPQKENSYEQWIKTISGYRFKVILDCPQSAFSPDVVASLANQAGVEEKEFYGALRPRKTI
jgi:hypothetical protein